MLKLFLSAFRRLITAVTSPFRMMIVRIQRMFNINILTAKLIAPLTKKVRSLITLKPKSKDDFIGIGKYWVFKKVFYTITLALCAGVFIYFSMFASKLPATTPTVSAVKTSVTYDFDDMKLAAFSGVANIKAANGEVVYTGDVVSGVCKGNGTLYDRRGRLVYEGGFDKNKYSGIGVSYYPSGAVKYEGGFLENRYQGEGIFYGEGGNVLYSGSFKDGYFSGNGREFNNDGRLKYEGSFAEGLYHGNGTSYYDDGTTNYQGGFFQGLAQGKGSLYNHKGKLIYTGATYNGTIDYRSLVGSTLADIETAFAETPRIFYTDQDSVFVFEEAGVIITVDCRVQVDTWEKDTVENSGDNYFMPEGEYTGVIGVSAENHLGGDLSILSLSSMASNSNKLTVAPMSWFVGDSVGSASSMPSNNSGNSSSSSSSSNSSSCSSSSESSSSEGSFSNSNNNNNIVTRPDFVQKDQKLYYEIDTNVWKDDESLDKSKIKVSKVTVWNSDVPKNLPAKADYTDNAPPSIEDCVAIDYIRQKKPTVFSNVVFEMDKQNKLFVRLKNINYASKVVRQVYDNNGLIYRYCYQLDQPDTPLYYSISS